MNCDELQSVYIDRTGDWVRSSNNTGKLYLKSEVDAAITELKKALNESEEARYEAGAGTADYYQENRRLKRALWLLKTRYFWILMAYASDLARVANPSIIHKSNILANPTPRCMEEYQHEAELYDNARIKCLNKAEEHK